MLPRSVLYAWRDGKCFVGFCKDGQATPDESAGPFPTQEDARSFLVEVLGVCTLCGCRKCPGEWSEDTKGPARCQEFVDDPDHARSFLELVIENEMLTAEMAIRLRALGIGPHRQHH